MKLKLKTRSSAAKRYQKTKTGKIVRRKAFKGHILEKNHQHVNVTFDKKV